MRKQFIIKKLNEKQKKLQFSGNVRVIQNSDSFTCNFGYANLPEKLENKAHTRFGIASGSKIFTAISICQLVEQD
ncbi:serine hydrolase [Jeotgalibaca arthritidis]|uniref:Serine hydrolase n=1 Tax=Jeotgalibaca arthritidis TaxID=1868794 RepID=A0A6G7KAX7_9LACT|nr:serine hydrolase [Jeotgalibaca arthritidis]QII82382.1 serine hydrolase [Jeotgalibaca arthritidis]